MTTIQIEGVLDLFYEQGMGCVELSFMDAAFITTVPEDQRWSEYDSGIRFSYDGLHILKNNDHLTIYDKMGLNIVWEGTIQKEIFPDGIRAGGGLFYKFPKNVDRELWVQYFKNNHPATLTPRD